MGLANSFFALAWCKLSLLVRLLKCFVIWPLLHKFICKNIFACLFGVHNTISLHVMNKYVRSFTCPMMGEVSLEMKPN